MATIVMKFGGTSVENSDRIQRAAALVNDYADDYKIVVVVSALAGTTDEILAYANVAAAGDHRGLNSRLKALETRHYRVIEELFSSSRSSSVREAVWGVLHELREFCDALLQLRSLTPQLLDVALPMGEKISAQIFSAVLNERGLRSSYVDASEILITDQHFGDASVDMARTQERSREKLLPLAETGCIPVVTGYCGSTEMGQPTTLGRGGSDTSATILGASLDADEVWIWTDVDGILTADPRICADARILPEITFSEAIELSYYGAKVIHRKAVRYAMESGIAVRIKNSFQPNLPGTKIAVHSASTTGSIKAVTMMLKAALITVRAGTELGTAADTIGRLFFLLGNNHIDVLFSMQSSAENFIQLAVREEDADRAVASIAREFRSDLQQGQDEAVDLDRELAVVAVLSERVEGQAEILARLFETVARCSVHVIAAIQNAKVRSICLVVPAGSASQVVKSIHDEFLSAVTGEEQLDPHMRKSVPMGGVGERN